MFSALQSSCINFFLEPKEPSVGVLIATWLFLLHLWVCKSNFCCCDKHLKGEEEENKGEFIITHSLSHDWLVPCARSLWLSKLPCGGQEAEKIGNQEPLSTFKNPHSSLHFLQLLPYISMAFQNGSKNSTHEFLGTFHIQIITFCPCPKSSWLPILWNAFNLFHKKSLKSIVSKLFRCLKSEAEGKVFAESQLWS